MFLLTLSLLSLASAEVSINFQDGSGKPLTSISLDGSYQFGISDSSVSDAAMFHVNAAGFFANGAEMGPCGVTATESGSLRLNPQSMLTCKDSTSSLAVSGATAVISNSGRISLGSAASIAVNCELAVQGSISVADYASIKSMPAYTMCYQQNVNGSLAIEAHSQLVLMGQLDIQAGGSLHVTGERKTVYAIATVTVENEGRLEVTDNVAIVDAVYVHKNQCKTIGATGELSDCTTPSTPTTNEIAPLPQFKKHEMRSTVGDMGVQFGYGLVTSNCMLQATASADHNGNLVIPNIGTVANQRVSFGYVPENSAIFVKGPFSVASTAPRFYASLSNSSAITIRPGGLLYWRSTLEVNPGVAVEIDNSASVVVLRDGFAFTGSQTFHDNHIIVCGNTCPAD